MTDLVYITGGKSFWNNNELRFALRSMCKHLTNMGNVFVVGKCPEWLTNVTFIEAEDAWNRKKEPNLYAKRLIACRDDRIRPTALFCYDDEYLLTPHDADNFPYYYDGTIGLYQQRMIGRRREGHHVECVGNTVNALGQDAKLYDVHCPILCDRHLFIQSMRLYDWSLPDGYLIKSTYANTMEVIGTEVPDSKLNGPDSSLSEYREHVQGRPWFSTGDNMNFEALAQLMVELYPEPCPYEK